MTGGSNRSDGNAGPHQTGNGAGSLLLRHLGASLIAVVDFVLFQATAIGLTIAVYFAIPLLDSSINQNSVNWNWIKIFQIISPTITVSGGAVTVLTSYFFAKRAQEAERQQQEAEHRRQEEARLRSEAERQQQEAEHRRQEEARLRSEAERQQQEAEHRRQEEARLRSEAERQQQEEARLRQVAEAEVQNLKTQLERANTPRRRHRRPLR